MRKSINFWASFATHPPALIRLLARKRRGRNVVAVTAEEVALTSGIPLARIQEISKQTNWEGVSIAEAERFCLGCGFDPTSAKDRNRKRAYEATCRTNRPRFLWIKNSPRFESEFLPLIVALRKSPQAFSLNSPTSESRTTS